MRSWTIDVVAGGLVGGLTGAVVALNLLVFSGMEQGYATSIPEAFRQNAAVGVGVVVVLVAGPILGVVLARRMRVRRPPIVVEAADADIPAIGRFFREAWAMTGPDAPGWAGASEEVIEHLTRPDVLAARIGGPERRMFLAKTGTRVVGFSATRLRNEEAELVGIVVLQDMVGRGIGTPLLEAALEGLRRDGARAVVVATEADNDRALTFYRSRGFGSERRVTEQVEGEAIDLVRLERAL